MIQDKPENWIKRIAILSVVVIGLFCIWGRSDATAQDKVVVIPLMSNAASGDAIKSDVLEGKTFSSSNGTGLVGTRPPAPVGTDYIETQHTVQPPSPRFYNINGEESDGFGVKDMMTGLIWQKTLTTTLRTHSDAISFCDSLFTTYAVPIGFISVMDWRLPTITELQSLIAHNVWDPALPIEVRYDVFNNLNFPG